MMNGSKITMKVLLSILAIPAHKNRIKKLLWPDKTAVYRNESVSSRLRIFPVKRMSDKLCIFVPKLKIQTIFRLCITKFN